MLLNNVGNGEDSLDKKELPTLPAQEQIKKSPQEQLNQRLAQELDRIRTLAIQERIEQGVPVDFTPDRFYFSTMIDIEPNKEIISNPIIISGINIPVVMKIEEGTIIQNGVDTGKNYILLQNGDKIELKVSSPELHGKEKSVTVDIGGQTGNFTIISKKGLNASATGGTLIKNGEDIGNEGVAVNSGDVLSVKMTTGQEGVQTDLSIGGKKIL